MSLSNRTLQATIHMICITLQDSINTIIHFGKKYKIEQCPRQGQSINMGLLKYDKTHIMTKYVGILVRVLKKHAN